MSDISVIFIRDLSGESIRAEAVLRTRKIEYIEVFSDLEDAVPVLLVSGSNYQYNGIREIEDYSISAEKYL